MSDAKVEHICGKEPNDDGRIQTGCKGCYTTAYLDGKSAGMYLALRGVKEQVDKAVRRRFDPLSTRDSDRALEIWEKARSVIDIAQEAVSTVEAFWEVEAVRQHQTIVQNKEANAAPNPTEAHYKYAAWVQVPSTSSQ